MSRKDNRLFRSLIALILLAGGALTNAACVRAAEQPGASSAIDADGDDERTELLYHWQDKRFSDEEQHQIVVCTVLVAGMIGGGILQRRNKQRRH